MSIGAAAFAVAGGVAGAARRCCASAGLNSTMLVTKLNTTANHNRSTRFMSISADSIWARGTSIERLAALAPAEAVRRPQQRAHAQPMIDGIAPRVARDDDLVAGLQRLARDALTGQRAGAAPFDAPALHLAVLVGRHDVHPRVRIAEHELHELALDLDRLALVVRRGKRMVRRRTQAREQGTRGGEHDQFPLHDRPPNERIQTQDVSLSCKLR